MLARAKPPPMTQHMASRTLVKSPPELWAECSDATSLARHLDQFGEITITRLEPETAVAWEGERARGTVRIEPSGWGTKVILTAVAEEEEVAAHAVASEPVEATEVADEPFEAAEVAPAPQWLDEPGSESREDPEPGWEPESTPAPASREEPEPEAVAVLAPVEVIEQPTDPPARRRPFARLFGLFRAPPRESGRPEEPIAVDEPAPELEPLQELEPMQVLGPVQELEPVHEPELHDDPDPEPAALADPAPALEHHAEPAPDLEPVLPATSVAQTPVSESPATETPATEAALTAALDSLGQAHHRPYSRA